MARKDLIHDAVKNALIKDGWNVNFDPFYLEIIGEKGHYEIDLGAEKVVIATKKNEKIAVEIKSISSGSLLNAFHTVLGQYLDYKRVMEDNNLERTLYIGVENEKYELILKSPFVLRQIEYYKIPLLIIDKNEEKILLWRK